jgi:hypothetical protein
MSTSRLLAACLVYATGTTVSHAQTVAFACPRAGTVEERVDATRDGAVSTPKYSGTSPGAPYICSRLGPSGKPEFRLFNFYFISITDLSNTAAANAPVRAGMLDLLSGRKASVSFPYTDSDGSVTQQTWTFVRKEPFTVNDKTFDTNVFDQEVLGGKEQGRNAKHYMRWLDQKSGLWLKVEFSVISGPVRHGAAQHATYVEGYRDRSITLP